MLLRLTALSQLVCGAPPTELTTGSSLRQCETRCQSRLKVMARSDCPNRASSKDSSKLRV